MTILNLKTLKNMRSRSVVIVAFFFISVNTFSQQNKLLFQASYDYISYPFINFDNYKNNGSYKVGGTITYYFCDRVSVASGINYESRKYKIEYFPNNSQAERLTMEEFDFSYIGLPLIFEFETLDSKSHLLAVQLGFELESLLSKSIVENYNDGTTRNGSNDNSDLGNSTSMCIGVSYRYLVFDSLFIGACPKVRYNLTSHGITAGESTALSFLFQLSLGYLIRFNQ